MRESIDDYSANWNALGSERFNPIDRAVYSGETVTARELMVLGNREVPMLIAPFFPKVGLVSIVGSSDTGKSAFGRQLATTIASGEENFLGFPINATHNQVLYVTTEDDHFATSSLLHRQDKRDYQQVAYESVRYLFGAQNILDRIENALEVQNVDVVAIDVYADLFDGEMNQANSVRRFLNDFIDLARTYECLFIFLHHTGKGKQNFAPSKDNILGSQAFEAKMRVILELRADPKDPSLRHMCFVKGNYLKSDVKSKSYELRFDENMVFHNTGGRVPFADLVPVDVRGSVNNSEKIDVVMKLKAEGNSLRAIEEKLRTQNIALGKSTVHRIVKKNSGSSVSGKMALPELDEPESSDPPSDDDEEASLLVAV
jgi:hypothetical protein